MKNKLFSPLEIRRDLEKIGLDVWSVEISPGVHVGRLYKNGQFVKDGNKRFKTWWDAIHGTERIIHEKLIQKK